MNMPSIWKRELTQWMDLLKQPLLAENEATTADSKTITILKNGVPVCCYPASLLNGKLTMTLPQSIQPVAPEPYQLNTLPGVELEDVDKQVKITLTHLDQRARNNGDVLDYKNQVKQALKMMNPATEWLLGGVKEVRGLQIAFFEVITTMLGMGLYNLYFFLPLQQRVVSGKFICANGVLKEWRPVFYQIMGSIETKGFEKRTFRNLVQTLF
ncbi:MAG TPA: hypothetical protein VIM29_01285 [Bacillota bacterium]